MRNKFLFLLIGIIVVTFGVCVAALIILKGLHSSLQTQVILTKSVSSSINAQGSIHSQNEATLHFQTGGTLVYLPFKKGDSVYQGQAIASLDVRTIQKNIQSAVDAYKNQTINFDIVNDFNGNRSLEDTGLSVSARRQLEAAVNTQDQAQVAVDILQIAQQQAVLTSPITGQLVDEDVTVPNVNVTTSNYFTIIDPTSLVFRANILAQDIDFISVGSKAQIKLDGNNQTITGSVIKIYPQKIKLSTGEDVYQIDVQSVASNKLLGIYGQSGTVLVQTNTNPNVILIPSWVVLSHNYVWVADGKKAVLKRIVLGKTHGADIEILSGLLPEDKVIVNPETVADKFYSIL